MKLPRVPAYWKELAQIYYLERKAKLLSWWTGVNFGFTRQVEVPNPLHAWPRNSPCYCGSKNKFKRCCRKTTPAYTLRTLAREADLLMLAARLKGLI